MVALLLPPTEKCQVSSICCPLDIKVRHRRLLRGISLMASVSMAFMGVVPVSAQLTNSDVLIDPARWPHVATVDRHYLSFNIEMAEVTGGEFWAPFDDPQKRRLAPRSPLDLDDPRLLLLAKALSPAIIRVSGTWANSTYVPAIWEAPPANPPKGFRQVLRPERWRALTSLVRKSRNTLLLSFPASDGARAANGTWNPEQAERLVALTNAYHTPVRAVEFINEPNLVKLGALPKGYTAADYARDFLIFSNFARHALPGSIILGHSSSGTGGEMPPEAIARAAAGQSDAVSYHFYGALSERCAEFGNQTNADEALSESWLSKTDADRKWYTELRDRYDPGKPLWLTETAQAACGGDRWASSFRDSFRFVDQLGRLAQSNVQIVAHNTLASGDYALVDRSDYFPRPNYWAAWLWRKNMGTRVLKPEQQVSGLRIYAHCHPSKKRAVSIVILGLSDSTQRVKLAQPAHMSLLAADSLDAQIVSINGKVATLDLLQKRSVRGKPVMNGSISLPPHSITFLEFRSANNSACR